MSPNNNRSHWLMFHLMGPLAFFSFFFSFILPPVGFLMAFSGYRRDKAAGERYVGWIVIMCISVLFSLAIIFGLIMLAVYGDAETQDSSSALLKMLMPT